MHSQIDTRYHRETPHRAALLGRIAASRQALEDVVQALPPDALAPGAGEAWTAGDHLWHLAAWESALTGLLQGQSRAQALGLSGPAADAWDDFAPVNELIRRRGRGLAPSEVLAEFAAAHRGLLATLDQLPDEAIFGPERPDGFQPLRSIQGNTFRHFDEHRVALEAFAAERR